MLIAMLALAGLTILSGCNKEIEPPSQVYAQVEDELNLHANSSSFIILDANDPCFRPKEVPETLIAGIVLSNQNIKLKVKVIKKGKWSFSTNKVNGYSFSGSGKFDSKGVQTIILKGKGTPIKPGNDRFIFKNNNSTARYDISVLDGEVLMESVPQFMYFSAKIDDVDIFFGSAYNVDNVPYGYSGIDTQTYSAFLSPGVFTPAGTGSLSVQKDFFYALQGNTEADFKNYFSPGAYPFRDRYCSRKGMIVFWVDDQNEAWSTIHGSGLQSGSSFKITGIQDGHDSQGRYYVKAFVRFNCKLYNLSTGTKKILTNGEAVLYFKKSP